MPRGEARTGRQREIATAARYAARGYTPQQAAESLSKMYGYLSAEQVQERVSQGTDAATAGKIMTARINVLAENPEENPYTIHEEPGEAVITVHIVRPDGAEEYRTIRLKIKEGMSDLDILNEVNSLVDEWRGNYGSDDTAYVWTVDYLV